MGTWFSKKSIPEKKQTNTNTEPKTIELTSRNHISPTFDEKTTMADITTILRITIPKQHAAICSAIIDAGIFFRLARAVFNEKRVNQESSLQDIVYSKALQPLWLHAMQANTLKIFPSAKTLQPRPSDAPKRHPFDSLAGHSFAHQGERIYEIVPSLIRAIKAAYANNINESLRILNARKKYLKSKDIKADYICQTISSIENNREDSLHSLWQLYADYINLCCYFFRKGEFFHDYTCQYYLYKISRELLLLISDLQLSEVPNAGIFLEEIKPIGMQTARRPFVHELMEIMLYRGKQAAQWHWCGGFLMLSNAHMHMYEAHKKRMLLTYGAQLAPLETLHIAYHPDIYKYLFMAMLTYNKSQAMLSNGLPIELSQSVFLFYKDNPTVFSLASQYRLSSELACPGAAELMENEAHSELAELKIRVVG